MADFLNSYSIQRWLELCPQGYLEDTVYGHGGSEKEPDALLDDDDLRAEAIRSTVQLVVGERAALAASSGLINSAPDFASKRFLATQTLDEARHVEIFTQRLYDLGVKKGDLEIAVEWSIRNWITAHTSVSKCPAHLRNLSPLPAVRQSKGANMRRIIFAQCSEEAVRGGGLTEKQKHALREVWASCPQRGVTDPIGRLSGFFS